MANKLSESALLFDLDGTLLDTAADLTAAVNYARETLLSLPPLSVSEFRPIVPQGTKAMVVYATPNGTLEKDTTMFRQTMLAFYREHLADLTRPFEGMDTVLNHLDATGIPWGIVTNKLSEFALPILEQLGLASRAACAICADMVLKPKPAADALLLAACELRREPHDCAYVGDALSDIQAAKNANMLAVLAEWGYLSGDEDFASWPYDQRFESPTDLYRWIQA